MTTASVCVYVCGNDRQSREMYAGGGVYLPWAAQQSLASTAFVLRPRPLPPPSLLPLPV